MGLRKKEPNFRIATGQVVIGAMLHRRGSGGSATAVETGRLFFRSDRNEGLFLLFLRVQNMWGPLGGVGSGQRTPSAHLPVCDGTTLQP